MLTMIQEALKLLQDLPQVMKYGMEILGYIQVQQQQLLITKVLVQLLLDLMGMQEGMSLLMTPGVG